MITVSRKSVHYNPDGAIFVTTPQGVAVSDVRREPTFCKKIKIPILEWWRTWVDLSVLIVLNAQKCFKRRRWSLGKELWCSMFRFYSTGSQSNTILRRRSSLSQLTITLNAINVITSKLLEMESNGDQWLKEQVLFFKKWLLSMWHLYSWTNVTEMAKWSTTGFLLTVPVSYQSNQWWELQQSSIKPCSSL